jgi:hypothetical protein
VDFEGSQPTEEEEPSMLTLRHRLAVAGIITVAAVALPAAAVASVSGSPAGKPPGTAKPCATACKPRTGHPVPAKSAEPSQLAALAASAGISVDRLQAGLSAAKRAGGNTAAGIAAFATSAGVPQATAQRIVQAVFGAGKDRGKSGDSAFATALAAGLASRLGISTAAAQHAVSQLGALSERGGVDPTSPAFAAIARDLGVTPARLAAALDAIKQAEASR